LLDLEGFCSVTITYHLLHRLKLLLSSSITVLHAFLCVKVCEAWQFTNLVFDISAKGDVGIESNSAFPFGGGSLLIGVAAFLIAGASISN
jgi:hypothetical protein